MKVVIVLAIAVSLSFALIPWSFRYQSTANLWEDDYDLIFDPARIPEIEGSRVWTGLSNFVTGGENLFSNGSVPFILLGGSTHFMGLFPAAVIDRSSMKDALFTGLVGPDETLIYGEGTVSTVTWQDVDNDGVIDAQTTETERRVAYNKNDIADYYAGIGYQAEGWRFGVGFMRQESKNTYTDPENNFNYDLVAEDLTDGPFFIERASVAGDEIFSSADNEFRLSFWYDTEGWSAGLMGGYAMFNWDTEALIIGDSVVYTFGVDPDDSLGGDYTIASLYDSLDTPESGTRIPVRLALFYDYTETAQGRFWVGYTMQSHSYTEGAIDFVSMMSEDIYTDSTWRYDTTWTTYTGEGSNNTITVGTHQLFNVNDRLNLGFGVIWNSSSVFDSTLEVHNMVGIEDYDTADTTTNDYDYVRTVTSSETWVCMTDGSTMSFSFPVGVEFYVINPKLCVRLGATHTLQFSDITYTDEMVAFDPTTVHEEWGSGADTTYYQGSGDIPSSSEIIEETTSSTNYAFGVGWKVNDNLQLDFMGFTKLTDMTSWELSATLHFD
jgi:hypothetical protein